MKEAEQMKNRMRNRYRVGKPKKQHWFMISVYDKTYKVTEAQLVLYGQLRDLKFTPEFEFRFCSDRDWRFDIAIREQRIAFECNGGRWTGGHFRGLAVDKEYEKLNRAQLGGWRVIQFTNEFILDGSSKKFLKEYLC